MRLAGASATAEIISNVDVGMNNAGNGVGGIRE
jgi:hypothetical protein